MNAITGDSTLSTHRPLTVDPATAKPRRPSIVVVAAAIEALVVTLEVVGSIDTGAAGAIGVGVVGLLLTAGLWQGSLLTQRLVLLGAVLTVVGGTLRSLATLDSDGPGSLAMLIWVAVRGAQWWCLTRPEARVFFGLDCPACGGLETTGASLFYGKMRCKGCEHTWLRAERHAVDVAAFD